MGIHFIVFTVIAIYIVIGFVFATIITRYTKNIDGGDDFILHMLLWPLMIVVVSCSYITRELGVYVYWLNNLDKIDRTYEFAKKIYILYGEDASIRNRNSYARYRVGKKWDDKIIDEYNNLMSNGHIFEFWSYESSESRFSIIDFNEKFTPYFYKRMKRNSK